MEITREKLYYSIAGLFSPLIGFLDWFDKTFPTNCKTCGEKMEMVFPLSEKSKERWLCRRCKTFQDRDRNILKKGMDGVIL